MCLDWDVGVEGAYMCCWHSPCGDLGSFGNTHTSCNNFVCHCKCVGTHSHGLKDPWSSFSVHHDSFSASLSLLLSLTHTHTHTLPMTTAYRGKLCSGLYGFRLVECTQSGLVSKQGYLTIQAWWSTTYLEIWVCHIKYLSCFGQGYCLSVDCAYMYAR